MAALGILSTRSNSAQRQCRLSQTRQVGNRLRGHSSESSEFATGWSGLDHQRGDVEAEGLDLTVCPLDDGDTLVEVDRDDAIGREQL